MYLKCDYFKLLISPSLSTSYMSTEIIQTNYFLIYKFSPSLTVVNTSVNTVWLGLLDCACFELTFEFDATTLVG